MSGRVHRRGSRGIAGSFDLMHHLDFDRWSSDVTKLCGAFVLLYFLLSNGLFRVVSPMTRDSHQLVGRQLCQ